MVCRTVERSLAATGEELRLSSGDGTDVARVMLHEAKSKGACTASLGKKVVCEAKSVEPPSDFANTPVGRALASVPAVARAKNRLGRRFKEQWIGHARTTFWPSRSPDLSSLDFSLWGDVEYRVYASEPSDDDDMKDRITSVCESIPAEVVRRVIELTREWFKLFVAAQASEQVVNITAPKFKEVIVNFGDIDFGVDALLVGAPDSGLASLGIGAIKLACLSKHLNDRRLCGLTGMGLEGPGRADLYLGAVRLADIERAWTVQLDPDHRWLAMA
ncbi:hypothetical protein HPB51_024652 [Rhipicephalus microplus]|uniref:Uncharacterized protein n=1 Tax=Rhipicephalus microplus TaxID=6941 RepID=A0A9J6EJ38_RHIMP|nr:hypothetical protein HPB51_024652 [Rhipicephalus microplus]